MFIDHSLTILICFPECSYNSELRGIPNIAIFYDLYKLLPTIWYCAYNGGITIPPCTKNVIWRILDLPLVIR